MKKLKETLGIIETAFIIILFACALLMVYMFFEELQLKNQGSELDGNTVIEGYNEAGAQYSELSSDVLLPENIAVKKAGRDMYAISSGAEYVEEIYAMLQSNLSFIFSSCTASETSEEDFLLALDAEELIYLCFHSELPAPLIYIHSLGRGANELADSALIGTSHTIREIIIFPSQNEEGEIYAISRDENGSATSYTISSTDGLKDCSIGADFDIYVDAEVLLGAYFHGSKEKTNITPSTLLYSLSGVYNKITLTKGTGSLSENKEAQREIALMLSINPDKTGSYFDSELGASIYMPTHGHLSFYDDKLVYSSSGNENGGIDLSDFSGSKDKKEHTLAQALTIAESLIKNVCAVSGIAEYTGGEAQLLITDFYSNESGSLVLEYEYFYDNIPLHGVEIGARVEFSSEKLTRLELFPMSVATIKGEFEKSAYPDWLVKATEAYGDENETYTVKGLYVASDNKSTKFEAEWTPIKVK